MNSGINQQSMRLESIDENKESIVLHSFSFSDGSMNQVQGQSTEDLFNFILWQTLKVRDMYIGMLGDCILFWLPNFKS